MDKYDWLSSLIGFNTTSRLSNLSLIEFIKKFLEEQGIVTHLTHHAQDAKANLFAIIPAADGRQEGGLVLSGHTDVVPVEGQHWDTDPFVATPAENKIFGRGACDMKGFIAVVLSLVPFFLKAKLNRPIYFAFSYDEEIGCLGVPLLIADVIKKNIQPFACIVGEPTEMRPVVAHKGKQTFRCIITGVSAHSSLTNQACNAIEYAARLICYIREIADGYQHHGPYDKFFDVPYTTLTTNLIAGGNSENTIPSHCEFVFEFRHLPDENANALFNKIKKYVDDELLPKMQKENRLANIVLNRLVDGPAFAIATSENLTAVVRKLTKVEDTIKVSYGTEAALFSIANIPTILCGPGSIEQAHRPNEFVTRDQLERCETFIKNLVAELCF